STESGDVSADTSSGTASPPRYATYLGSAPATRAPKAPADAPGPPRVRLARATSASGFDTFSAKSTAYALAIIPAAKVRCRERSTVSASQANTRASQIMNAEAYNLSVEMP